MTAPIGSSPDHAPYCDSDGWLLPMDQWPEYSEDSRSFEKGSIMAHICEVRFDCDDHYISLGLFPSVAEAISAIQSKDGPSGDPVSDYGDDGEEFDLVQRYLGRLHGDDTSRKIVTCRRVWRMPTDEEIAGGIDEDSRIWSSVFDFVPTDTI